MTDRARRAVGMLTAQALTLGLLGGFVVIPASGIFLAAYGAPALAFVYVTVAVIGGTLVPVMHRAVGRWPLRSVAVVVVGSFLATVTSAWIVLEVSDAAWVSFVLEVFVPLALQLGFTVIGGQAGRVLTVREMKERFARIVSGFVVGFFIAGVACRPLLSIVGAPQRLLVLAVVSASAFLFLVVRSGTTFAAELGHVDIPAEPVDRMPLGQLVRNPLVAALLGYQLLSTLGTQLVEYLVYDRASARYTSSADLARFTSTFTVVMNAIDIVFVVLVAGWLLRRFGMRLGLVANPVGVSVLVASGAIVSAVSGVGVLAVFLAVGAARIVDISLSDGSTRGSINTAFQALPPGERLSAQATVEGLGQPAAIGLSGVLLLVVRAVADGSALAVMMVTIVICIAWTVSAFVSYRGYRSNLHRTMRARMIQPEDVAVDESGRPASIAPELAAALLNHTFGSRAAIRLLRRCPRRTDEELTTLLLDHVDHPSRDLGLEIVRVLGHVAPPNHPARAETAQAVIIGECVAIVPVLEALAHEPYVSALVRALADERELVRDRTLAAIGLISDTETVTRAGHWIASGDHRREATAIETIEVLVPARVRRQTVALLQTALTPQAQLERVAQAMSRRIPRRPLGAVLDELIDLDTVDEARRWTSTCAIELESGREPTSPRAVARCAEPEMVVCSTPTSDDDRRTRC